jgi:hypothetical protein
MQGYPGARTRAIFAIFVVALAALPASASAYSWEEPTRLSHSRDVEVVFAHLEVDMNEAGEMETVWDADAANPQPADRLRVRANHRAATGSVLGVQTIATSTEAEGPISWDFHDVAVEPDGDSVALVRWHDGMYASFRPRTGGQWSTPQRIDDEATRTDEGRLAVDNNGNVVAFYQAFVGDTAQLRRAEWNSNTKGAWTHTTVSDTANGSPPIVMALDMNDAGAGVMVAYDPGTAGLVAYTKESMSEWSATGTPISDDQFANPQVAGANVDSLGNAHIVFSGCRGSDQDCMWEVKKPANAPLGPRSHIPHRLAYSGPNSTAVHNQIDFAPDGRAIMLVNRGSTIGSMTYSAGTWSLPVDLPESTDTSIMRVAISQNGSAHVAYWRPGVSPNPPATLRALRRAPGETTWAGQTIDVETRAHHEVSLDAIEVTGAGEPAVVYRRNAEIWTSRGGEFPRAQAPATVDFGSVEVGASSTRQVTLSNTGDAPLHVSEAKLTGPFTAPNGTGACEGTLNAGASCEIQLTYTSTEASERAGALTFTHNARGNPTTVSLVARGHYPPLQTPPAGNEPGDDLPGGGDGGGNSGGSGALSLQQAGQQDARNAGLGAPKTIKAADFAKRGISQPVVSSLPNTVFRNQTNGIIASGPGNLIGQAGTNLIGEAGTNLIGEAGTNLIGEAGTNPVTRRPIVAAQAAGSRVKCPRKLARNRKVRNRKVRCKVVTLATGTLTLPTAGAGMLVVRPTSAGKKILRQAARYAKRRRKKGRKVKPLTLSYATVVRPGGPSNPGYYSVSKLSITP